MQDEPTEVRALPEKVVDHNALGMCVLHKSLFSPTNSIECGIIQIEIIWRLLFEEVFAQTESNRVALYVKDLRCHIVLKA